MPDSENAGALGQGACMAIEDGMFLGRAFAASQSLAEAFPVRDGATRSRQRRPACRPLPGNAASRLDCLRSR